MKLTSQTRHFVLSYSKYDMQFCVRVTLFIWSFYGLWRFVFYFHAILGLCCHDFWNAKKKKVHTNVRITAFVFKRVWTTQIRSSHGITLSVVAEKQEFLLLFFFRFTFFFEWWNRVRANNWKSVPPKMNAKEMILTVICRSSLWISWLCFEANNSFFWFFSSHYLFFFGKCLYCLWKNFSLLVDAAYQGKKTTVEVNRKKNFLKSTLKKFLKWGHVDFGFS